MRNAGEIRYARAPDGASIAYQVFGDRGPDVLLAVGIFSHLSAFTDFPVSFYSSYLQRLSSFSRLVAFDHRGNGLSDPLPEGRPLSLDEQARDLLAVLDAAGVERAAVLAEFHAGAPALRLAAEHPDRVGALILNSAYARFLWDDDYPIGMPAEEAEALLDAVVGAWSSGASIGYWQPELADDTRIVADWAHFERLAGSPARIRALTKLWMSNDARAELDRVRVPTFIMHCESFISPLAAGHYLVERIPHATFSEYPPSTEISISETVELQAGLVCEYLTGTRVGARADRVLGVLLFMDVVGSTARVAATGDRQWREDLDLFRHSVDQELERNGARLVNTRGDDLFALCSTVGGAIESARGLRERAAALGFEVRAGLHVAEVEDTGDDVLGMGVHVASRVCDVAGPGEILVTDHARAAVLGGSDHFEERGSHQFKGIPGEWLLAVVVE